MALAVTPESHYVKTRSWCVPAASPLVSRSKIDGTGRIGKWLARILFTLSLTALASCDLTTPGQPVTSIEAERIKAELDGRSFRQFEPPKEASPRKSVLLDFYDGLTLWAQYAEGDRAVYEWEIAAADYRIEKRGDTSQITIYFEDPRFYQGFAVRCDDCIDASVVTISIRNVFDSDNLAFRLNDPTESLPSPFPVFQSWIRFTEDEVMN